MRPMTFTEAFVRAQSAPSCRYLTYWQTRCDQELTRVYRAAFPRRKLPLNPNTIVFTTSKSIVTMWHIEPFLRPNSFIFC